MTTGFRWGRRALVRLPGIGVTLGSPFEIGIQLRRELSPTPPAGVVTIAGLSDATRNRIASAKGQPIEILAGYASLGGPAPIFSGTVANVVPRAVLPGWSTEIEVTSVGSRDDVRYAISVRSYGSRVAVRQVVEDIVADMGMSSDLSDLPASAKLSRFVWAGDAAGGLAAALRGVPGTWFEEDGVIRFAGPVAPANRAIEWTVSQETGMIGAPFVTDSGIDVAVFLTPGIRLADVLVLSGSAGSDIAGRFRIRAIRYSLASFGRQAFAQQITADQL